MIGLASEPATRGEGAAVEGYLEEGKVRILGPNMINYDKM
jgi:hypothetical protein